MDQWQVDRPKEVLETGQIGHDLTCTQFLIG